MATPDPDPRPPILVCEDDPHVAQFFVDVLEAAGHRVVHAADGATAVRLAQELRPAALVLDLALPDLDGAAVLARLKADPGTAAIPIVVVSAYPGWLTLLDRRQAVAVVEKPCLPDDLQAAVAQALASSNRPR